MKKRLTWEIQSTVGGTGLTHIVVRAVCACGEKIEAMHDDFDAKCEPCGTSWKIPTAVQSEARRQDFKQRFEAAGVRAAAGGSGALIPI